MEGCRFWVRPSGVMCLRRALMACAQSILVNVAPKKPNWDLRRDVEKKLVKLERRTQRALIEIMQAEQAAKLEADGGIQD